MSAYPRFSPSDGGFSVQYPKSRDQGPITVSDTMRPNGVEIEFGDIDGSVTLFGQPADHRTARNIVEGLIQSNYPGARIDYEIPNAMVGYQPGYGVVEDYSPMAATSNYAEIRVLVLVAVKNDLALVATAAGPHVVFEPATEHESRGSRVTSHPSGAGLALAQRIGPFINSFIWQGDAVGSADR